MGQAARPREDTTLNWYGKAIGGALGWMLSRSPVGALIGVILGHQFDARVRLQVGAVDPARVQSVFLPATFRVMGHIAKADGRVSEQEIAAARSLMDALHLGEAQRRAAIDCYTEGKQPEFELATGLAPLRAALAGMPQLAQFFIELQLQVAIAGNGLSAGPRARLRAAATMLGFSGAHYDRLETLMRWRAGAGARAGAAASSADPDRRQQAYALLEITPQASDEQVVKAYRRQMSRHHPDKLAANGLPPEMLERAKERTQQIQAAYEWIKLERGMR